MPVNTSPGSTTAPAQRSASFRPTSATNPASTGAGSALGLETQSQVEDLAHRPLGVGRPLLPPRADPPRADVDAPLGPRAGARHPGRKRPPAMGRAGNRTRVVEAHCQGREVLVDRLTGPGGAHRTVDHEP